MTSRALRKTLLVYLALLVPLAWLAMKYDLYDIDGDAVAYMDIADLLHAHKWSAAVNGYWHPLYPSVLWLAQVLFHPTRMTELKYYYWMNLPLFLVQVVAMGLFVRGLVRLRERMSPGVQHALGFAALYLFGLAMLVIAIGRELSLGKVRTDGLLQGLILLGLAMLMECLASESLVYAPLMGLFLGLAYLTKSFAFVLTLLCVMTLVVFAVFVQRRRWTKAAAMGALAVLVFGMIAGPYVVALSMQKHRLTFGDSGTLNYVWYVSQTEKMHLEPWMTDKFGSAEVHLLHPEKQLMFSPGVYSYKEMTNGTYPPWFDTTYWNDHIVPKFSLQKLAVRDSRNVVLIFRYLLNHIEPLLLIGVLVLAGATLRTAGGQGWRWHAFAWPAAILGVLMWGIYTMVNVEERYVTVAYLAILLPLLAAMRIPGEAHDGPRHRAAALVMSLFAVLLMGQLYATLALNRRVQIVEHLVPAWRDPRQYGAAQGLRDLGLGHGEQIACIGAGACLYDNYWARLADVRILTEVYEPTMDHLMDKLDAMPNRDQVMAVLKNDGARVVVAQFDPGEVNELHPAAKGWLRLGNTDLYALPLNLH